MKHEVLIFLDLEANQEVSHENGALLTKHKLLQLSALKIINGKLDSRFNKYCKYDGYLNDKVRHLLHKSRNFFMNQKEDEAHVYKSFQKFCGGNSKIYCYGNYDQIVLDSVKENNQLDSRIELIDYSNEIAKRFNINSKLTPSQSNLCNIFDIKARSKHNAINDAFALWLIYKNVNKIKDDNIIIDKLYYELLRPKNDRFKIPFFKKVETQTINDHFYFIFNKTKITNNYEIVNDEKQLIGYKLHINLYIYNNRKQPEVVFIRQEDFKNKKDAEDYMYQVYVDFVFDKIKNAVVIYDSGQKSEIGITKNYKKHNDNIITYYLVVNNKVDAHFEHFNKKFETEEEQHQYLMKIIKKYYNKETKSFDRIIK